MNGNEDPDLENVRRAALNLILDRYRDIREERKSLIKLMMGLSGSAVVLSVTFLEKLAPNKTAIPLIWVSWAFLCLSVLTSILFLVWFNRISIKYQLELHRQFAEGKFMPNVAILRDAYYVPTSGSANRLQGAEIIVGVLFLIGILCLAGFAVANLV